MLPGEFSNKKQHLPNYRCGKQVSDCFVFGLSRSAYMRDQDQVELRLLYSSSNGSQLLCMSIPRMGGGGSLMGRLTLRLCVVRTIRPKYTGFSIMCIRPCNGCSFQNI